MATIALLRIILGLDRVNADEVTAMALGFVIATGVALCQVVARAAALVAIETPFLLMALAAVVAGLAGKNPVSTDEIRIMVGGNTF